MAIFVMYLVYSAMIAGVQKNTGEVATIYVRSNFMQESAQVIQVNKYWEKDGCVHFYAGLEKSNGDGTEQWQVICGMYTIKKG